MISVTLPLSKLYDLIDTFTFKHDKSAGILGLNIFQLSQKIRQSTLKVPGSWPFKSVPLSPCNIRFSHCEIIIVRKLLQLPRFQLHFDARGTNKQWTRHNL